LNIRLRIVIWHIFLWPVAGLQAQTGNFLYQAGFAGGSIIRHRPNMAHLVRAHPSLFRAGIFKTSVPGTWESLFNYPDRGLELLYQNFYNEDLGHVAALNYTMRYYLRNRNKRPNLLLTTGIGAAYTGSPFDFETNIDNISISTHFGISVLLGMEYTFPLFEGAFWKTGILFTHYSNSSVRKPNLGINTLFVNTGISIGNPYKNTYEKTETEPPYSRKWSYWTALTFSAHEVKARRGLFPVLQWTGIAVKRYSCKSAFQTGTGFVYSWANKDYAAFDARLNGKERKDFKEIDIFAGHRLYFHRWYLDTRLGYYVYNPLGKGLAVFEYIGMNYRIADSRWQAGFGIKAKLFKADFTGLSLYYQIK